VKIHISRNGKVIGPYSHKILNELLEAKILNENDWACEPGMKQWVYLRELLVSNREKRSAEQETQIQDAIMDYNELLNQLLETREKIRAMLNLDDYDFILNSFKNLDPITPLIPTELNKKKNTILTKEENEKENLRNALLRTGGNRTKASDLLGISRRTLHRKLNQWPELAELTN